MKARMTLFPARESLKMRFAARAASGHYRRTRRQRDETRQSRSYQSR